MVHSKIEKYEVVTIEPSHNLMENRLDFISTGWDSFYFNDNLKKEMNAVTSDSNINFLVTLEPFSPPSDHRPSGGVSGYGLYTRCAFGICKAWSLKSIGVRVYAMNPPRLIAGGYSPIRDLPVSIDFSLDLDNLPVNEIDKAKTPFINYLHEIIISAIQRARLL